MTKILIASEYNYVYKNFFSKWTIVFPVSIRIFLLFKIIVMNVTIISYIFSLEKGSSFIPDKNSYEH